MTKFRAASALTIAASLIFIPAPGFAAIDPIYGTDPELDQACSDLQKPSDESGYTSYAIDIVNGTPSSVTVDDGPTVTVGIGAVSTVFGNYNGAHVNGQSVNIHAYGDKVTSYAGGATETTPTKTTTTVTRSAGCHVHKLTEGNDQDPLHEGYNVAPAGLQTDEPVSATTTTVTYGTRTTTIPGPWIDLANTVYGGQFVICISPGRNPGAWRGQNGYVNQIDGKSCSRAWYDTLGSTPSVSVPAT